MCGRLVIASAKFNWNNLPVCDMSDNDKTIVGSLGVLRQKLFQKDERQLVKI